MTNSEPLNQLMTIGQFARLVGLTTKALRVYEEQGLLRPFSVDDATGYRRYSAEQAANARLIGLLRGADMSLNAIEQLLSEVNLEPTEARRRLDQHLSQLESQHSGRRLLIRHIHSILRKEEYSMFIIETRHVASQRVMSIQRRLLAPETDAFVVEAKEAFAAHLGDGEPVGPFTLIFHGTVDNESDGPIEAILPCRADVQPTETIGIRTEPAHDEAFTTITKDQWSFPAIMAAYDAVACSPAVSTRPRSSLSCREIYRAEPEEIGGADLICDVAFPLA